MQDLPLVLLFIAIVKMTGKLSEKNSRLGTAVIIMHAVMTPKFNRSEIFLLSDG